ncbi:hypothetical protein GLOTRDRAFT_139544 [Gloeophyllum trabeum ATCC 11539]|uniref:Uncharacterized protein n=1 Tax=Gloeophyllum trabeum (strain ATCC 11539 / FP-39264 / Madison 617) TaxID=670483 RepID=S7RN55_GLOTA|nr:uncharacterized protein GLOTRDRAFT_139544 [Gloeophyllum trabeum ATCC 11539]EPQ54179.1 hypothetical protein GLOTRDRAFT_139544 [Gloeophyllum trabeum ATCC 11539]
MCCRYRVQAITEVNSPQGTPLVPDATEILVAQNLPDGYWLEAFHFHKEAKYPDLVGYGLGFEDKPSTITLFVNPMNYYDQPGDNKWHAIPIQTMDFPVAMTFGDFTGDGYNDIVICDRYGPSMTDLWDASENDGGRVQWLRNPGDRLHKGDWTPGRIGNSTGMHRLKVGHFTTRDQLQVMAIPIISKSGDLESSVPVLLYTPCYDSVASDGPTSWAKEVPFLGEFRLIHDIKVFRGDARALDTVLVAGREGVCYLYHKEGKWKYEIVGTGLPREGDNPYWGSGSVDVGMVHDDPVGYIATCEGFHGNSIAIYVKNPDAPKGTASLLDSSHWARVVVDNFGPLTDDHTGTVHHVATGDFDANGVDAFAIACMGVPTGTPANEGVYLYRMVDITTGKVRRTKITNRSAGRLAIASFRGVGLDIGSISYYVPGYHVGPECPSIRINSNALFSPLSSTDIRVHRLEQEVLFMVPRPNAISGRSHASMSVITVAGKKLHLYVLPPGGLVGLDSQDAVKVIHGSIIMKGKDGSVTTRKLAPERHQAATTQVLSSDGRIQAGDDGAVFLRMEFLPDEPQGPYTAMSELPIANSFPASASLDVQALQFSFVKVEQLPWASNGNWDDFEFYNMTGFHVFFGDDAMEKICHIQLWTLGLGETARFHIHDTSPFCEIHCCISNGGGEGGMRWFPDGVDGVDPDLELTKAYVEANTQRVACPPLFEHGPLWKVQDGFRAKPQLLPNGCADYPWHAWLASRFGDWTVPVKPPLPPERQRYDVWLA